MGGWDVHYYVLTCYGGTKAFTPPPPPPFIFLTRLPPNRVLPFGMKDNFWEMGKIIQSFLSILT